MFLSCLYVIYSLLYGDSGRIVFKSVLDRDAINKPLALLILAVVAVATMPLFGFLGSMFLFNFVAIDLSGKGKTTRLVEDHLFRSNLRRNLLAI